MKKENFLGLGIFLFVLFVGCDRFDPTTTETIADKLNGISTSARFITNNSN